MSALLDTNVLSELLRATPNPAVVAWIVAQPRGTHPAVRHGSLLVFAYHGFDRIVIHGHLSALMRPKQVVCFFRQIVGVEAVASKASSIGITERRRFQSRSTSGVAV